MKENRNNNSLFGGLYVMYVWHVCLVEKWYGRQKYEKRKNLAEREGMVSVHGGSR